MKARRNTAIFQGMTDNAPDKGWLVCVRVWSVPDEFYFAAISDASQAEEQVRGTLPPGVQAEVQATRELTADEMAGLHQGQINHAPK
ncbi:MAG: hypothetical protein ACKVP3_17175 [Hyphomicrobiaceae bacterium]